MNEFFKTVASDKIIRWGNIVALFFLTLSVIYIALVYNNLPPFIPIFNQMPWGELRISEKITIIIPQLITFVIFFINIFFAQLIYKKLPLIARMLCITSILISLITLVFTFRITQLIL